MEDTAMGINLDNIKSKVKNSNENNSKVKSSKAKTDSSKTTNKQIGKSPNMKNMDYIDSGLEVTKSVIELVDTITKARQESKRMELNLQMKQVELETDLEKLRMELTLNLEKIKVSSQKTREQTELKLKEIGASIYGMAETEKTKRIVINKNHEERMHVLETQRHMLTKIMELYTKYYEYLFAGRTDIQFPADLPHSIQTCISTLNTALQTNPQLQLTQIDYISMED